MQREFYEFDEKALPHPIHQSTSTRTQPRPHYILTQQDVPLPTTPCLVLSTPALAPVLAVEINGITLIVATSAICSAYRFVGKPTVATICSFVSCTMSRDMVATRPVTHWSGCVDC
jgi:hypothetical protein